jgi:isopropylmalate/homocitrate/citramalate synthase
VVEVGPRDGLQNEPQPVATETKAELIARLAGAGLKTIEVTAFVSPRRVPQMADHDVLLRSLRRQSDVTYAVLVPNMQGFEAAVAAGAEEVAVFAAASESFSQHNIGCSIAESMDRFRPVLAAAKQRGVRVRGYVSCALGCPYEGAVAPSAVAGVARELHEMGCWEISLGDTIGLGTPLQTKAVLWDVAKYVPVSRLAGHYHDTWGRALLNVYASLEEGVRAFDSSVAGLGGCPYAPGAAGNVATEDLVAMLHALGVETGIDLRLVCETAAWICERLGRTPTSKVGQAMAAQRNRACPGQQRNGGEPTLAGAP